LCAGNGACPLILMLKSSNCLTAKFAKGDGWGQVRALHSQRGRALVAFFDSFSDCKQTELFRWSALLRSCLETTMVNRSASWRVYRRRDWLWILPKAVPSVFADAGFCIFQAVYLALWKSRAKPLEGFTRGLRHATYLFPCLRNAVTAGGQLQPCRWISRRIGCESRDLSRLLGRQLTGRRLPGGACYRPVQVVCLLGKRDALLQLPFRKSGAAGTDRPSPSLTASGKGRFSVAGTFLERRIAVPPRLEYNDSEVWMAGYWDPARFERGCGCVKE